MKNRNKAEIRLEKFNEKLSDTAGFLNERMILNKAGDKILQQIADEEKHRKKVAFARKLGDNMVSESLNMNYNLRQLLEDDEANIYLQSKIHKNFFREKFPDKELAIKDVIKVKEEKSMLEKNMKKKEKRMKELDLNIK